MVKAPSRKVEEDDDNARPPFKSASAPRATLDTPEHSATAAPAVRVYTRVLPPQLLPPQ